MLIKDLEMTKELSGKDLAAVRGGSNFAVVGGASQQANLVQGPTGFSLVGPIAINAPTNVSAPTVTQTDLELNLANITNVAGIQEVLGFQI